MPDPGWFGIRREMLAYLRTVGADRTPDGKFIVRSPDGTPAAFMGDTSESADIVVSADVEYFVDGHPKKLAAGLATTSYGMSVLVF